MQHQDPFYQLGKLYVYKLQVELFQYASEQIDTGVTEIDAFETLKTFNTNTTRNSTGGVTAVNVTSGGSGYTSAPTVQFTSGTGYGASAVAHISAGSVTSIEVTSKGSGYQVAPIVQITSGGGTGCIATAEIAIDIDKTDSFGDNNKFKAESANVINFDESNPFGEINNA